MKIEYRKLKDGTLSPRLVYQLNGRRIREKINIRICRNDPQRKLKRLQIEEIRSRREAEIYRQEYGLVNRRKILFNDYFQDFIDRSRLKSIRKYQSAFARLKPYTEGILISGITKTILMDYLEGLYNEISIPAANSYMKCVKKILNSAVSEGLTAKSPASGIRLRSEDKTLAKQVLSMDEIRQLHGIDDRIVQAFVFCCLTGLGFRELIEINEKNISKGRLIYRRGKNQKKVIVPLNATALQILEVGFFKLPSQSYCSRRIKDVVSELEIDKQISWYCARHSFAVNLLLTGANLETVRSLMGHANFSHTMKYVHYAKVLNSDAVHRLNL